MPECFSVTPLWAACTSEGRVSCTRESQLRPCAHVRMQQTDQISSLTCDPRTSSHKWISSISYKLTWKCQIQMTRANSFSLYASSALQVSCSITMLLEAWWWAGLGWVDVELLLPPKADCFPMTADTDVFRSAWAAGICHEFQFSC